MGWNMNKTIRETDIVSCIGNFLMINKLHTTIKVFNVMVESDILFYEKHGYVVIRKFK